MRARADRSSSPAGGEIRTKIIGLGNEIRSDDGVGLHVLRQLRPHLKDRPSIELIELPWGGLRLMEHMTGCQRAIVIDAMRSEAPAGTLRWLVPGSIATYHSASSHDVNLATALELGRLNQAELPADEDIHILGIEIADVETYSDELTPTLQAAVPRAVEAVLERLEALAD